MKCQMGKKCVGNGTTENRLMIINGKVVCRKCYKKIKQDNKEMYKPNRRSLNYGKTIRELLILQQKVNKKNYLNYTTQKEVK